MTDGQLEQFVGDWLDIRKQDYVDWQICGGAGDGGRDVVGFETKRRYEGPWHNYQCKRLKGTLSLSSATLEIGKLMMHVAAGQFPLPARQIFVAPYGIARLASDMMGQPERFRRHLVESWDAICRDKLVKQKAVVLTPGIRAAIDAFNFEGVSALDGFKLVTQPDIMPALVKWFGADPGPPPPAYELLPEPSEEEAPYLGQLMQAYAERAGTPFEKPADVMAVPKLADHLRDQRIRYIHAVNFGRHYRQRVFPEVLVAFDHEIYHGVVDVHRGRHDGTLEQVNAVMSSAAALPLTGVLRDHAGPQVKQGTCHRLANEDKLPWGT